MKPILVIYATREGHTRKIAEHVAATIRGRGDEVDVVDAAQLPAAFDLKKYAGAVLAASVHLGRHEHEMFNFARRYRADLERIPTAFLSISLAEASVEDSTAPYDLRAEAAQDVKRLVDVFCTRTGLHPTRVWPLAGALLYTHYGAIEKIVMRMIAKRSGGDTDTSRDHEYTDWKGLDRFVSSIASEIEEQAAPVETRQVEASISRSSSP
jgi:menaquinone-dependent protoporphyrinogen oxidase